jgi:transmembrane sensor
MERHALRDAADWFVRLQDRRVNSITREKFTEWLLFSPDHVAAYFEVTRIYGRVNESISSQSISELVADAKADTYSSNVVALSTTNDYSNATEEPVRPTRRRAVGIGLAIAASLITVSLVVGWRVLPVLTQPHFVTQVGEQRSVPLADGSLVYLNTDSDLTVDLSGPERRITLTKGEARFTVAKDPKRPFIVSTKHASVRALGTIFNVQTGSERTAVSVIEGRIEVTGDAEMTSLRGVQPRKGQLMQLVLRTGEQAMVNPRGQILRDKGPPLERVMAWPNGRLVFRDEPLIDLVTDFNRYHHLPLHIADPELAAHRVNGAFDAYDRSSLIQFLERYEGVRLITAPDGSQWLTRAESSRKSLQ